MVPQEQIGETGVRECFRLAQRCHGNLRRSLVGVCGLPSKRWAAVNRHIRSQFDTALLEELMDQPHVRSSRPQTYHEGRRIDELKATADARFEEAMHRRKMPQVAVR